VTFNKQFVNKQLTRNIFR